MSAIGTVWASDTWSADIWGDGTWGDVGNVDVGAIVAANLRTVTSLMSIYGSIIAITPSDTVNISEVITGLYVGAAGNVSFETLDGITHTLPVPYGGVVLPFQMRKVLASGTTATNLHGLR